MKLLMHACCGPCSVNCIESLKSEKIVPDIFWFNPNIHPFTEYLQRRNNLEIYAQGLGLNVILKDEYKLNQFLADIFPYDFSRCKRCYKLRIFETARTARELNYDAFTTTLLISIYQDHELIIKTAQEAAKEYKIEFLYRDFRPHFREGQNIAKEQGLYMQKYCGCIFSEEDRYLGKKR